MTCTMVYSQTRYILGQKKTRSILWSRFCWPPQKSKELKPSSFVTISNWKGVHDFPWQVAQMAHFGRLLTSRYPSTFFLNGKSLTPYRLNWDGQSVEKSSTSSHRTLNCHWNASMLSKSLSINFVWKSKFCMALKFEVTENTAISQFNFQKLVAF